MWNAGKYSVSISRGSLKSALMIFDKDTNLKYKEIGIFEFRGHHNRFERSNDKEIYCISGIRRKVTLCRIWLSVKELTGNKGL